MTHSLLQVRRLLHLHPAERRHHHPELHLHPERGLPRRPHRHQQHQLLSAEVQRRYEKQQLKINRVPFLLGGKIMNALDRDPLRCLPTPP